MKWITRHGIAILAMLYVALRLLLVRGAALDSDEPQHLHVVWAWTQHGVPYRDAFDNHMPLFHMLCAPLLTLLGERADILDCMRLAMVPLAVAAFVLAWRVGRALWGASAASFGLALLALEPTYERMAGQFRADTLWALAWIAAMAALVLVRRPMLRALLVGLAVGVAMASSLKTLPLLGTALVMVAFVLVCLPKQARPRWWSLAGGLAIGAAAATAVMASVVAIVASRGGLADMHNAVLGHNMLPGFGRDANTTQLVLRCFEAGIVAIVAGFFGWRRIRHCPDPRLAALRWFVAGSCGLFAISLYAAWPLLTSQDYLPVLPLFAPWLGALLLRGFARLRVSLVHAWIGYAVLAAIVLIARAPWHDRLHDYREQLATVLAITTPVDAVMDAKGESIYRRRVFHPVLEMVTQERLRRGLLADTIVTDIQSRGAHVLHPERLPESDARALRANFIPYANGEWVAGRELGERVAGSLPVAALIPGCYRWLRLEGEHIAQPGPETRFDSGDGKITLPRAGRYRLMWCPAAMQAWTRQQ
ncbi:hypothetical protein [Solilutibacter silvestris]|uniref:Dolichyl-phosphate-mannose-protein mannosyltransferase n=1 Tax=Solilutibacter silvestris TaxID=1645665 RepID=A0A2K1PYV8_9GAMM|nr:hypothetical protein [Lysobacter silvestris]PNS07981.1 hypothetical protein Lysil_2157 [Lysobacter silvestris]